MRISHATNTSQVGLPIKLQNRATNSSIDQVTENDGALNNNKGRADCNTEANMLLFSIIGKNTFAQNDHVSILPVSMGCQVRKRKGTPMAAGITNACGAST